jgi:hypothetical protein
MLFQVQETCQDYVAHGSPKTHSYWLLEACFYAHTYVDVFVNIFTRDNPAQSYVHAVTTHLHAQ